MYSAQINVLTPQGPSTVRVRVARPEVNREEDPLNTARGVVVGLMLAVVFWTVVAVAVAVVLS